MVSGQKRCGLQMMGRKAVEGDWLILNHTDRLKFQPRLALTGAIVIDRNDDLSGTSQIATIQMRSYGAWRTITGRVDCLGTCSTYPSGRVCASILIVGSSMTNIERGCRSQYSCSDGSSVLELELHILSLELLRWLIIAVTVVFLC